MITIKILYMSDMTTKFSDKIMFIGYGCPSIADIYFQIENYIAHLIYETVANSVIY